MILLCTYDWLLVKNLIDINVHREAHLFSLPNDCLWYDKLWGASQRVVTLFKLFHLASMTCCSFVSLDIDNCLSCCFPPAIKCIKITNRPPILDIQTKLWLLWPNSHLVNQPSSAPFMGRLDIFYLILADPLVLFVMPEQPVGPGQSLL